MSVFTLPTLLWKQLRPWRARISSVPLEEAHRTVYIILLIFECVMPIFIEILVLLAIEL